MSNLDPTYVHEVVSLAGVKPRVPGQTIEPGFYTATVVGGGFKDVAVNEGRDAGKTFKVLVLSVGIEGAERTVDVFMPFDAQDRNRIADLRTLYESAGYTDATGLNGAVGASVSHFAGKTLHVEVRKREGKRQDGTTGEFDRLYPYPPADWSVKKNAMAAERQIVQSAGVAIGGASGMARPAVTAPTMPAGASPTGGGLNSATLLSALNRPPAQG